MTRPVLKIAAGLIVADHRREEFQEWNKIRKMKQLRVAVQNSVAARAISAGLLPNAIPVAFEGKEELDQLLAAGAPGVDAILTGAEKGAAWTILHPQFNLVAPAPTLLLPVRLCGCPRQQRPPALFRHVDPQCRGRRHHRRPLQVLDVGSGPGDAAAALVDHSQRSWLDRLGTREVRLKRADGRLRR